MATIPCQLEYKILFPENSIPPTDFSIVTDSAFIQLTFNENGVAELSTDITCTLPDSFASQQYTIAGVFLDNTCANSLAAGTLISIENLTNISKMGNEVVSGTLIVYIKVEVPKYLITWNYKTITNENKKVITEVFRNSLPTPPSFTPTFIATKENTPYIYSFDAWTPTISEATADCTYNATYSEVEYKTDVPYLINNISLFEKAVPYYYGSGSPYYNCYLPLGEDEKPETTEDIKIQTDGGDKYTVVEKLEGFKIDGKSITYIKKGTFPKLGEKFLIWDTDGDECLGLNKADTPGDITNCVFKGHYDADKKLTKLELIDKRLNSNNTTGEDLTGTFHEKYPNEFGENELPTRIGFLLVAGGGGAGGVSFFTNGSCTGNNKDDSSKEVTVPGAGGGGGAITIGVFNFDYPKLDYYSFTDSSTGETYKNGVCAGDYALRDANGDRLTMSDTELQDLQITSIEFHVTGGSGGAGNGGKDTRGGNNEDAHDGKEGYDANIYIIINAKDSNETKYSTAKSGELPPKVLSVCGGFGGKKGDYSVNEIEAGAGGKIYNNQDSSHLFYLASYTGGNGASVIIQSETGSAGAISAYNKSLYLSLDTPPADYRIDITHPSADEGGTADPDNWTACIFGGYSFGMGGRSEAAPTKGGGGCSLKTTAGNGADKFENKNKVDGVAVNEPTNGANGYFGIYY